MFGEELPERADTKESSPSVAASASSDALQPLLPDSSGVLLGSAGPMPPGSSLRWLPLREWLRTSPALQEGSAFESSTSGPGACCWPERRPGPRGSSKVGDEV